MALLLTACNSRSSSREDTSEAFRVTLDLEGWPTGVTYLGGIYGDQYYTIDSFMVDESGTVEMTYSLGLVPPGMYFATLPDRMTTIQFLVDKDQQFSLSMTAPDPISSMKVKGSTDNALLYENLQFEQQYQAEYSQIRQRQSQVAEGTAQAEQLEVERLAKVKERTDHVDEITSRNPNSFFSKFKSAGKNPSLRDITGPDGQPDQAKQMQLYRQDYWADYDFSDERLLRTPVYSNKLKSFFDRILIQNADSIIPYADLVTRGSMANDSVFKYTANWLGVKYREPTFMGADAVYTYMVQNFWNDDLAFWADQYEIDRLQQDAAIRYSSQLGQPAKDLTMTDPDGNDISLLDSDAKLIVLYVYTPECENCQKETPQVKQVYDQWRNRGVDVFALCTDPDGTIWKNYISNGYMGWRNAYDPDNKSGYQFKYHVDITPEIYVIDQDRKIVAKDLKAFQLPTIFERHL